MIPELRRLVARSLTRVLAPLARPVLSGMGSILLFHRVAPAPGLRRVGWCRELEVTPGLLEALVRRLRRRGYAFVSIGELHDRLLRGRTGGKCVVVTFDDGYLDSYTRAYPLLKQAGVPFTLYLATGFADRTIVPWWYLAEELLARRERVELPPGPEPAHFELTTPAARERAFSAIVARFNALPPGEVRPLAVELFGEANVRRAMDQLLIGWEHVRAMAEDPLVTIGAHTVNHRNLLALSEGAARWEMAESKRILEGQLGRPVEHFAYPFGSWLQAGPREFSLARQVGFKTAVTTRTANVMPEHAAYPEALPRLVPTSVGRLEQLTSGAQSLIYYRKRVVMDR